MPSDQGRARATLAEWHQRHSTRNPNDLVEIGVLVTVDGLPSMPMTVWSGLDVHTDVPKEVLAIEDFYKNAYLKDIAENNPDLGLGHLYEILVRDPRRSFSSKFLTTFDLLDEDAIEKCSERKGVLSASSAPASWHTHVATSWSLMYRRIAETGPSVVPPYGMYLVGVNAPAGIDASGLEEFNEFYTNVHVPEVAERRHCLRATRYELYRELIRPPQGSPQFLAIYEVDEKAAKNTRHIGGPYSRGPEVWRKHTTPWRLWYRQLPQ